MTSLFKTLIATTTALMALVTTAQGQLTECTTRYTKYSPNGQQASTYQTTQGLRPDNTVAYVINSHHGTSDTIWNMDPQPVVHRHPSGREDSIFDGRDTSLLLEVLLRDEDGDETEHHYYKRDGALQKSEHKVYRDVTKMLFCNTFYYSTNGAVRQKRVDSYDKQGRMVNTCYYTPDDELFLQRTIKYNKAGDVVMTKEVSTQDGQTSKKSYQYRYTYDDTGRWIARETSLNGKIIEKAERSFRFLK